jgi:DNA-binding beta-propeller fold protein YncE
MMKKWLSGFLFVIPITLGVTIVTLAGSKTSAQVPSFQPLLLAFDATHDRLYAAIPTENADTFRLVVFAHPGQEEARPGPSIDLPGICSGISFDSASDTLFAANGTGHELLIFDHPDLGSSARPTRVLRRFNFPTGVYVDRPGGRLIVADAHPGSVVVFQHPEEVQGEPKPDMIISGEKTGLNGPFSIAVDTERSRLYVSNFDGVLVFNLRDLSALPDRLPLPPGTLARSLSFDPLSRRLYIATPMLRSFFIYDGERLEQVRIEGITGVFPFSMALDQKNDRLFLSGTRREVGVIEKASGQALKGPLPKETRRPIDRWIRWEEQSPRSPERPSPSPGPPGMGPEIL